MENDDSSLCNFIALMKQVAAQTTVADEIMRELREPAIQLASSRSWIGRCIAKGLKPGRNLIHEEEEHKLAILLVKWPPNSR
jgi:hypothetical protein